MEQFLIFVMLAGFTHAFISVADTHCDATHMKSQCSVTAGGCVYIQMMSNATGYRLWCKKKGPSGDILVFNIKKGKVTIQEPLKNRTEFFINNGTLKISSVEKNDSGRYNIEVYDTQLTYVNSTSFTLDVNENTLPPLILAAAVLGAVLVLVVCSVLCTKWRHCKRSG